mmetsp:Transcript_15061/g.13216  ORF Transcript_15061/g.13216 Transcript_15061/m.13216 type:complete len:87 (+) Transcript_15061:91-351(+)
MSLILIKSNTKLSPYSPISQPNTHIFNLKTPKTSLNSNTHTKYHQILNLLPSQPPPTPKTCIDLKSFFLRLEENKTKITLNNPAKQ